MYFVVKAIIMCVKILQEARAILGRLEYQRGNMEEVLRIFDGIDFQGAIENFQPPASDKTQSKKSKSYAEPTQSVPQQAPILVLEGMYLKSKSLQKLGRLNGMQNSNNYLLILVKLVNFFI